MNERIKEIVDKAMWNTNKPGKIYQTQFSYENEFRKQFAELIIKECANIIDDSVNHRIPASEYSNRLKEHFGIE